MVLRGICSPHSPVWRSCVHSFVGVAGQPASSCCLHAEAVRIKQGRLCPHQGKGIYAISTQKLLSALPEAVAANLRLVYAAACQWAARSEQGLAHPDAQEIAYASGLA